MRFKELFWRFVRWFPLPSYTRQRPLSEYSREDFRLAFRFAPERRAEIVNRGTMSRNEFIELQQLNLDRLQAEMKRRIGRS